MIDKVIKVTLGAEGAPPLVKITQGDTVWLFKFQVFLNDQRYTIPSGAEAILSGKKPDGHGVELSGSISDNMVSVACTGQFTAVSGLVDCTLQIFDGSGKLVNSGHVLFYCAPDAKGGAEVSDSDLSAYEDLIAQHGDLLEAAANITGMTASAEGLPTGSSPTVEVTGGSEGVPYNLEFGIPAGPVGPANAISAQIRYQAGSSPSTPPTGTWQASPPSVNQGEYLWTRTVLTFASGSPVTSYSVARQGINGVGSPGSATPLPAALNGSTGSSPSFSREDHVHPLALDLIYPVGSIYLSVNSANPSSLFGGTWGRIQDKFLLAAGSSYAAGSTGGAAEHAHSTGDHALTVAEMPAHTHEFQGYWSVKQAEDVTVRARSAVSGDPLDTVANSKGGSQAHNHGDTGSAGNLPPYLAVYVWKRTA